LDQCTEGDFLVLYPSAGPPSQIVNVESDGVDPDGIEDNGDFVISVCDYIHLVDQATSEPLGWWHIENITVTIYIELFPLGSGVTMYLDWLGDPLTQWGLWDGPWHEIWPAFCTGHTVLTLGTLEVGQSILLDDDLQWIIIGIGVDIWVCQEVAEPTGRCCVDWDAFCYDGDTAAECYARPGFMWDWVEGGTCANDPCPQEPTGACCVDNECVATNLASECDDLDGEWFIGETCPDYQCPQRIICPEPLIYGQRGYDSDESWGFKLSDSGVDFTPDLGLKLYENVPEILVPVCDLHWWGLTTSQTFVDCIENPMDFEIGFYLDNAGLPGASTYLMVHTVPGTATGRLYGGRVEYQFDLFFDPCLDLAGATWVSIWGVSDPQDCLFVWAYSPSGDGLHVEEYFTSAPGVFAVDPETDLSICLTGEAACPTHNGDLVEPFDCVNVSDLLALLGAWGTPGIGAEIEEPCDIVNVSDLLTLLGQWGGSGCP
jgi:hypothetical protein